MQFLSSLKFESKRISAMDPFWFEKQRVFFIKIIDFINSFLLCNPLVTIRVVCAE